MKRYNLSPQKNSFDLTLLGVVSILVIFGLVVVWDVSAVSAYREFGDSFYYIRQQLIWAVLGIIAAFFFANFHYTNLKKFTGFGFLFSLILLVSVFVPGLGSSAGGVHRWLSLGELSIQPAEIVKFAAVAWFATIFEKKVSLRLLLLSLLTVGFLMGFLQKDLGSTIVFVFTSVIIYVVSGGSLWQIFVAAPLFLGGFIVLIAFSEYRRKRILAFLDPFSDPQGFSYHISQVLVGLGSGGIFGLGLGQSRQKFYIPEVTTDSIFAVIGEELGLIGGVFVIGLFTFFILRGFRIAQRCPDHFGKILASGITACIGTQAIVNLGAMVSLFPLTGVPLPFISYGGSALVANLAAVGILLNISKSSP